MTVKPEVAQRLLDTNLIGPVRISGASQPTRSLVSEMERLHVPAVSIAVVLGGRVQWAKAYGVADESGTGATVKTLFQAASITKSITATAALRLVQDQRLDLDSPVDTYLKSWTIPPSKYSALHAVTLRELLSNTAGTSADGFEGYDRGARLPTLEQILAGKEPANSVPVVVEAVPGTAFRYSGGGFLIAQRAMMDVTGESFPQLMERLVLAPIGMHNSTFEQPLSTKRLAAAAFPADGDGHWAISGPHTYPEMAAGGLWTTPTDLALWIISIQRSLGGKADQILSPSLAQAMVSPVRNGYGLGMRVQDHEGSLSFNHDGSNSGYKAMYVGFVQGDGVVVMTNSDSGFALIAEIIPTLASIYRWTGYAPQPRHFSEVSVRQRRKLIGSFQAQNAYSFTISMRGGKLQLCIAGGPLHELLTSSARSVFEIDNIMQISFKDGDSGDLVLGSEKTPFHRFDTPGK